MITLLLFGDTHLGFDFPLRPKVEKTRRGLDFFRNYERVLEQAILKKVDLVIHGGDLFFRSKVPPKIVDMAYERLFEFARSGIPIFVVPGNHERSRLPQSLFVAHPGIHVFHKPGTFRLHVKGAEVAVSGFPFFGGTIREEFPKMAASLSNEAGNADIRILCMHEIVEGATIGPSDYTFRYGDQVIRKTDLPSEFHCILSGHIHRQQALWFKPGAGCDPVPVVYPGSVERTSFAEMNEEKGFYYVRFERNESRWTLSPLEFSRLPARPMIDIFVEPGNYTSASLSQALESKMKTLDPDSVVRLRFDDERAAGMATASFLRGASFSGMNISLRVKGRENRRDTRVDLKRLVKRLPSGPGVYMLIGDLGRVIYVGKSRNLRNRVSSYFQGTAASVRFRRKLRIEDVKTYTTGTELLALLLEDRLIKKYMPELNERQKEFNDYQYLAVTDDPFPALAAVNNAGRDANRRIFGPFKDRYMIERLREILCRNLGMRHCVDNEPRRQCMKHDAGLCSGPCFRAVSQEDYLVIVRKALAFLEGESDEIERALEEKMTDASERLDYESAAKFKETLRFAGSFRNRQKFLKRFCEDGLILSEKSEMTSPWESHSHNPPASPRWTCLFLKGALVKVLRAPASMENARAILCRIARRRRDKTPEDRRFLIDRGNIVYNYLNREGVEHHFIDINLQDPGFRRFYSPPIGG